MKQAYAQIIHEFREIGGELTRPKVLKCLRGKMQLQIGMTCLDVFDQDVSGNEQGNKLKKSGAFTAKKT
jgi:hypothetical protein